MRDFPKISVIIPAYNAQKTIYDAIQSVLDTEYPNLEIIVSDDASFKPYDVSGYPGVSVLRSEENRGAGVARQRGLARARGAWVVFLDADDLLRRNIFDVFYKATEITEDIISCCFVQGDVVFDSETVWATHGKIYRKTFLSRNRIRFDPELRNYEDCYFNRLAFRVATEQNGIKYNENVCWDFIRNPDSTTHQKDNWIEVTEDENINSELRLKECNYNIFKDEFIGTVIAWRHHLDEKEDYDRKKWFRLFDSVKRMYGAEDYGAYCGILDIPISREEKLYQSWRLEFGQITLSVIIPLYNSHRYIAETLDKLYRLIDSNKTWQGHVEVILTDDRSDVPDYSYLRGANLHVLYNSDNVRMGENRNRGLRMAKGKWVTFLDHDDELTADLFTAAFCAAGEGICIISGQTRNVTEIPQPYNDSRCPELVHGVLYRREFLLENNIWFSDKIKTSEDSYFNRLALLAAKFKYGTNSVAFVDKIFYRWCWHDDSTFFSTYNGRTYSEEFYFEYVKAILMAYDFDFIPDSERSIAYLWVLHNAEYNLRKFESESANVKKGNIKVLCSYLLFLREHIGLTRENFFDFCARHDDAFRQRYPEDYMWMNPDHEMKYSIRAFDILDKISDGQLEKIRKILAW